VSDLADIDFAYSPPLGTANDAMNMAAYTAENKLSGFSPSVTVSELDAFVAGKNPVFVDVRDVFAYEKSHISGALNIPLELLIEKLSSIPADRPVIVYDETGKKGHQALRTLVGAGFADVTNVSGGHASLQRQARAVGFKNLTIDLLPIEKKNIHAENENVKEKTSETKQEEVKNGLLIVDVRTVAEFNTGAFPGALNIPLDDVMGRLSEFGTDKDREIIVYCASGGRSAYAQRLLNQAGFTQVANGGGISQMMAQKDEILAYINGEPEEEQVEESNEPLIVDVRTVQEFRTGAYPGAVNIPLDDVMARLSEFGADKNREITVYCASGGRSAYAQRILMQAGYKQVTNGGGISQMMAQRPVAKAEPKAAQGPLVVDVRTVEEFRGGAYPGAVNIPLDDVMRRQAEFGADKNREIVVYCASGGRSAYAQRMLMQLGYTNVTNGGGIMQMMSRR
jgi:rhodanese-related sulfurtransferase